MTPRAVRRIGLTVVAGLALGACGDANKIESKADFIAAADKVCAARDANAATLKPVASAADLGRLSAQLASVYDQAINDIEALDLPSGTARAGAQKFVTSTVAVRRPVDAMKVASRALQAAAEAKDAEGLKEASQTLQLQVNAVQALNVVADQAARDYGMRKCGSLTADQQQVT
jgi:hypothetical protein